MNRKIKYKKNMNITTNHNIGDKVFFLSGGVVENSTVTGIEVYCNAGSQQVNIISIFYKIKDNSLRLDEKFVFGSKKELLESL